MSARTLAPAHFAWASKSHTRETFKRMASAEIGFLHRDDRCVAREHEVEPRVRRKVCLEFCDINARAASKRNDAVNDEVTWPKRRFKFVYVGRSMSRLRRQISYKASLSILLVTSVCSSNECTQSTVLCKSLRNGAKTRREPTGRRREKGEEVEEEEKEGTYQFGAPATSQPSNIPVNVGAGWAEASKWDAPRRSNLENGAQGRVHIGVTT